MSKSTLRRRRLRRNKDPKVLARREAYAQSEAEAKAAKVADYKKFMKDYYSGKIPRKRREKV